MTQKPRWITGRAREIIEDAVANKPKSVNWIMLSWLWEDYLAMEAENTALALAARTAIHESHDPVLEFLAVNWRQAESLPSEFHTLVEALTKSSKCWRTQGEPLVSSGTLSLGDETEDDFDDQVLPEDEAIAASHPLKTGRHDLYENAHRMVSAKYSKGSLVMLVNWLLSRVVFAEDERAKSVAMYNVAAGLLGPNQRANATKREATVSKALTHLMATVKAWGEDANDHDGGMPDAVHTAYKAAQEALKTPAGMVTVAEHWEKGKGLVSVTRLDTGEVIKPPSWMVPSHTPMQSPAWGPKPKRCPKINDNPLPYATDGPCAKAPGHEGPCVWTALMNDALRPLINTIEIEDLLHCAQCKKPLVNIGFAICADCFGNKIASLKTEAPEAGKQRRTCTNCDRYIKPRWDCSHCHGTGVPTWAPKEGNADG